MGSANRTDLTEYARELGYHRSFDGWAEQVVRDIHELAELFRAAAAAREAISLKNGTEPGSCRGKSGDVVVDLADTFRR